MKLIVDSVLIRLMKWNYSEIQKVDDNRERLAEKKMKKIIKKYQVDHIKKIIKLVC